MGYNGGTNKRGYYRRLNGMYSKSSYKSGVKILTNTILGGLGLIAAAGSAIANAADDIPTNMDTTPKHFNPKTQRRKYIIWGIIATLCPIAGFLTFEYAFWWMFCSVLLFGFIETLITASIVTPAGNTWHNKDYIYKDEVESVTQDCKTNRNILIALFITLFILNLYPVVLFTLGFIEVANDVHMPLYCWDGGETSIPIILVIIKLFINGAFIVEIFRKEIVVENYKIIRKRKETACTITTETTVKEIEGSPEKDDPNHKKEPESSKEVINKELKDIHLSEDIKLPKANGQYMEDFWKPYGTLHIHAKHATIGFSFPGPDQRYKSTYFHIREDEIDKYIDAYKKNWAIAEKLLEQTKNLPNIELKQKGEMNMDITVNNNYVSIYLYYYHLPLHTKKECEEMITAFKKAKIRIKQVRETLFA